MADRCEKIYDRILPGDKQPEHVRCTYVEDHPSRCSWETLRLCDEADAAEERQTVREALAGDYLPNVVRQVVEGLTAGTLDKYIELILAAGHDRKRTKRGVIGFPRRTA